MLFKYASRSPERMCAYVAKAKHLPAKTDVIDDLKAQLRAG